MGFTYLKGGNWAEITRDERFYCAELYFEIRGKENDFVKWLNTKTDLDLNENMEWEIGYEVCFYRDYIKNFLSAFENKLGTFPHKRTFDLCLFSENEIVIVEAKAQQGFNSKQIQFFEREDYLINNLIKKGGYEKVKVKLLGICSSIYITNDKKYGRAGNLEIFVNKIVSWNDLSTKYNNMTLLKADNIYKK